jgi:hypothetical protein
MLESYNYIRETHYVNSLGMQVVHINYHIIITKYKNFKMIHLIHIISILNFFFSIMLYTTRWTKKDLNCIYFEEFLN